MNEKKIATFRCQEIAAERTIVFHNVQEQNISFGREDTNEFEIKHLLE